jgi:hypothetical protein
MRGAGQAVFMLSVIKHGLDTDLVYVQGVQMVQVHTAGQFEFTTTSGTVTLQSSLPASDLILPANPIERYLMLVMGHRSLAGQAHLKEKSMSVTRLGSLTDLTLSSRAIRNALDLSAESTPEAKNHKPEEFMETSVLDELDRNGFTKKLWQ